MKRRFRLTRSADFKRVRRLGKAYPHPLIVLIAHPNELAVSRFAVVAGRSLGNAVQRNRAKRLIREAINQTMPAISPGWDIILIARHSMSGASIYNILDAIRVVLRKAGLTDRR